MENSKDGTRVDLGEDLLDGPTRTGVSGATHSEPTHSPLKIHEIDDQLHSARILIQENLYDEAKKVLRKVAIQYPESRMARHLLAEIQELELKILLTEDSSSRKRRRLDEPLMELLGDPKDRISKLDSDLKLGISNDSIHADATALIEDLGGVDSYEKFAKAIEEQFAGGSVRERLDIAIAFHEMGLKKLAARLLKPVLHAFSDSAGKVDELKLGALALFASSLIDIGNPFDATLELQPIIQDTEVPIEKKLELFYLMGRASELIGKSKEAELWFEQAAKIDPYY
ncbi:MAG: hypothetical protein AABZ55_04265, partial [Bdellovibrionota bacterium]